MKIKEMVKKKREPEYYFFSGKGGVGKTSVAAATALKFSCQGKKTLIISVDPAHSLSDSFETNIGGEAKKLGDNLFAVEIDPEKSVEEYKEKLSPQLEKMDALKGLGIEGIFDVAGMTPGIDELAAFDRFLQYMHQKEYDVIIFDTAPTGHALRFLSLPDVLDSWVGKMIKVRMQFSGMINLFKKVLPFGNPDEDSQMGMEHLDAMKKRIEEAKLILSDPKKTHYWVVSIAEQMSVLESERAVKTLESYKIPVQGIVVNQLIPKSDCSFCRSRREMQNKSLARIHEKFKELKIREIPLFKHEVKGFSSLEKIGELLS